MTENLPGIGLFGGTFDPVHNGHLIVAEWLTEILQIEKTYFIPAKIHPFQKRNNITDPAFRWEMLNLAIKGYPRFIASDCELKKDTISFAIETIQFFKKKYPDHQLYYFIGSDNLDTFMEWKEPNEILKLCYLAVYSRSQENITHDLADHPHVIMVDSPLIEISSSHIRKRIQKQMPFKSLVPNTVFDYIMQKKLYHL